jgi:hypothetical protein
MNACKVCIKSFHTGHKGCCSTDCYLQVLQSKLDDCFKRDTSHTQLLTALV